MQTFFSTWNAESLKALITLFYSYIFHCKRCKILCYNYDTSKHVSVVLMILKESGQYMHLANVCQKYQRI